MIYTQYMERVIINYNFNAINGSFQFAGPLRLITMFSFITDQ